jgi:hypothetical protein
MKHKFTPLDASEVARLEHAWEVLSDLTDMASQRVWWIISPYLAATAFCVYRALKTLPRETEGDGGPTDEELAELCIAALESCRWFVRSIPPEVFEAARYVLESNAVSTEAKRETLRLVHEVANKHRDLTESARAELERILSITDSDLE